MTRYQALFFDAGGTLFREVPPRHEIYALAARKRGISIDGARMAEVMGAAHAFLPREIEGSFRYSELWFHYFVDEVFSRVGLFRDLADLHRELFAIFRNKGTFRTFAETRAVLKRMKGAGIPLGVVSNWSPRLPGLLGELGLLGDFSTVISSATAHLEKPDPAIFVRALEQLGATPSACLHVGDHPENDYQGARALGMDARLLDRYGRHPDHPDRIASLNELLPLCGLPLVPGATYPSSSSSGAMSRLRCPLSDP